MIPAAVLTLPYFDGLRLSTIDVTPLHTMVPTFLVSLSGGVTLLHFIPARPVIILWFTICLSSWAPVGASP